MAEGIIHEKTNVYAEFPEEVLIKTAFPIENQWSDSKAAVHQCTTASSTSASPASFRT